ncbi:Rhs family protein [Herbaspirillum sp. CF444]|nr:Rhs family protein [Herbaspirillum sp. CF444]
MNEDFSTQAVNFVDAVSGGVDPRTGLFNPRLTLGQLVGNHNQGPSMLVALGYSPLQAVDLGYGVGFSLGHSYYDTHSGALVLSSGEQYRVAGTPENPELRQKHTDHFRFEYATVDGDEVYRIVWKDGRIELLAGPKTADYIKMPSRMLSPLGYALDLKWNYDDLKGPRLAKVSDDTGATLLRVDYGQNVSFRFWPDTAEAYTVVLSFENGQVTQIDNDSLSTTLEYQTLSSGGDTVSWLNSIHHPTGLLEEVKYQDDAIQFASSAGRSSGLPAVVRYEQTPGAGQAAIVRTYTYSSNSYLASGASVDWSDTLDPLYGRVSDYTYWSEEQLVVDDKPYIATRRTYNTFHLLVSEQTDCGSRTVLRETDYFAEQGETLEKQPKTFLCPKQQKVTWTDSSRPVGQKSRSETATNTFDDAGNLLTRMDPDGTKTEYKYYPAAGEKDGNTVLCPPEPNGFVRFMKSRTVTPPSGAYTDVPVVKDVWEYRSLAPYKGRSSGQGVLQGTCTHWSDSQRLYVESFSYVNSSQSLEHGRMSEKTTTTYGPDLKAYKATQTFAFEVDANGHLKQTVGASVDQTPGQADTPKLTLTSTRIQSVCSGRLQSETDAVGNTVAYEYDAFGRPKKQTHHPDKSAYTATQSWDYALPGKTTPAQTTVTDIRGNRARSSYDGLGRIVKQEILDADGALGWRTMQTHAWDVKGRNHESRHADTFREVAGSNSGELALTMTRAWDDWSSLSTETGKEDGIVRNQMIDPVGQSYTDAVKKPLGWLTSSESWISGGKALGAKTRTYYDSARRPVVTETFEVTTDGTGWKSTPYSTTVQTWDGLHRLRTSTDALGRVTTYSYDAMGRTVSTQYADGSVVSRGYAPFSLAALATRISLTPAGDKEIELGTQTFDGLGRLRESTAGGRTTSQTYEQAWQIRPSTSTGPDGVKRTLITDAALGEALKNITTQGGGTAIQQDFTYEKPTGMPTEATEGTTKVTWAPWSSGLQKTESTQIHGSSDVETQWQYSLGGQVQSWKGPGGVTQTRLLSPKGRLASVSDPSVDVTLDYDDLQQLKSWKATDKTTGATLDTTLTPDSFGREIGRTLAYVSGATHFTQELSRDWKVNGLLAKCVLIENGVVVRTETFDYDNRNRLFDYTCAGTKLPVDPYGNEFTHQHFTFDALGNIRTCETTLKSNVQNTATYHFDNAKDPCQLSRVTHSQTDTKYGYPAEIQLEYDDAGRMKKDEAGRKLDYDALGRLQAVGEAGAYGYDAHNRMVYQKVNATDEAHRLYYRGERLVYEWITQGGGSPKPGDKQVRLVHAGGACVAQATSADGKTATVLTGTDGKQSVVMLASGQQTEGRTYTPYGYCDSSGGHQSD